MLLNSSYLFIICVILVAFSIFNRRRLSANRASVVWLLGLIRILRQLIEFLPKHRGMSNAFLRGDDSFKAKMFELQKDIDNVFQQLLSSASRRHSICKVTEVNALNNQWQSLKNKVFSINPKQSFEDHTILNHQVLLFLEDACEDADLAKYSGPQNSMLVTMLSKYLPLQTEILGQIRGMGTGIAAQGVCNVSCRIKLKFLQKKVVDVMDKVKLKSTVDMQNVTQVYDNSKEATQIFAQNVKQQLIDARVIEVGADEFYQQGTKAIEANFRLFDTLLPIVEQSIQKRA